MWIGDASVGWDIPIRFQIAKTQPKQLKFSKWHLCELGTSDGCWWRRVFPNPAAQISKTGKNTMELIQLLFFLTRNWEVFVKCQQLQQTGMKTKSDGSFGTIFGCEFLSWVFFWGKHLHAICLGQHTRVLLVETPSTWLNMYMNPTLIALHFNNVPLSWLFTSTEQWHGRRF